MQPTVTKYKYAAENGNVADLKQSEHADLVESTVRPFSTLL